MVDLYRVVLFLHVLAAVSMGGYLFLPVLLWRMNRLLVAAWEGTARPLALLNRIGQYALALAFLTGDTWSTRRIFQ